MFLPIHTHVACHLQSESRYLDLDPDRKNIKLKDPVSFEMLNMILFTLIISNKFHKTLTIRHRKHNHDHGKEKEKNKQKCHGKSFIANKLMQGIALHFSTFLKISI